MSSRSWDEVIELAVHADRQGWDGVWFADHFMGNNSERSGGQLEVWSVLAAIAQATERVRIGPLVTSATYRHPAVLANIAATVDHISNGRLIVGLGAGWQVNEHEAYGLDLGTITERSDRLEEACAIVGSLLHHERTDFAGSYFTVSDAPCEPRPIQQHLPLMVAGKGERRTMLTAARYADEWNGWCRPDEMSRLRGVLAGHCEAEGRDLSEMACSTQAFICISTDDAEIAAFREETTGRPSMIGTVDDIAEQVQAFADSGADELIIPDWTLDDRADRLEVLDSFFTEVVAPFRSRQ